MGRIKELFKNKLGGLFKKSSRLESTAKHSLEKLGKLLNKRKKSSTSLNGFSWDQVYTTIFSPISRKHVHQIFIIALIGSVAYGTGKIVALFTSSTDLKSKTTRSQVAGAAGARRDNLVSDLEQIKRTNLFNARESTEEAIKRVTDKPKIRSNDICLKSERKSSLPLKLVNTIVLQDTVKSIASVQVRSSKELLTLRQGDKINSMAKIGYIDRKKVILQNLSSGTCEHIENVDKEGEKSPIKVVSPAAGKKLISSMKKDGIKNEGNNYTLKRSFVSDALKNISDLLSQARAIPIRNPDGSMSFKMTDIVPGSLYTQLGIQNDDIITEIDGKKIKSMNEVMQKFGRAKDTDNLQLAIQRDGVEVRKDYSIE